MNAAAQDKKRILLVDRRGPERQVLEALLARLGYLVVCIESVDELESTVSDEEAPTDLVVLDAAVVGGQADDLARRLCRSDRRVILVQAADDAAPDMIGFLDLTEDSFRGIGVRVPEIVLLINDLLYSGGAARARRQRRIYGGYSVDFAAGGESQTGSLYNLSTTGAFIETLTPVEPGKEVTLRAELPGGDLELRGQVTWLVRPDETEGRRSPPGMGLRFIDLSETVSQRLSDFVASGGRR